MGIVFSLYLSVQSNIYFLQILVMDSHLSPNFSNTLSSMPLFLIVVVSLPLLEPNFSIPLGSMSLFLIVAVAVSIPLLEYIAYPSYGFLVGRSPTPLQRVGLGFLVTILAMALRAIIERTCLNAMQGDDTRPISVLWITPCMILVGLREALYFPEQLAFFLPGIFGLDKGIWDGSKYASVRDQIICGAGVVSLVQKFGEEWIENDVNARS